MDDLDSASPSPGKREVIRWPPESGRSKAVAPGPRTLRTSLETLQEGRHHAELAASRERGRRARSDRAGTSLAQSSIGAAKRKRAQISGSRDAPVSPAQGAGPRNRSEPPSAAARCISSTLARSAGWVITINSRVLTAKPPWSWWCWWGPRPHPLGPRRAAARAARSFRSTPVCAVLRAPSWRTRPA
jgi:hypothetical protein